METLDTTILIDEEPIVYSEKFSDDSYEYRYVTLPASLAALLVPGVLMNEKEWRQLGLTMSPGWIHCGCHLSAPNILWFRRPLFRISTPSVTTRQETRPRLTKSANDLPKANLPTMDSASTVLKMRRLVVPDEKGFGDPKQVSVNVRLPDSLDLPMFNLSLIQPAAPSRTVTLRSSLQTRELLRL